MVWVILAILGIPLWLCAVGILMFFFRNRSLRHRLGDIPVRVLRPGKRRWTRGHGVWISDVFAFRGSPAAWSEDLVQVRDLILHDLDDMQLKKLRRLGPGPTVATLSLVGGGSLEAATDRQHGSDVWSVRSDRRAIVVRRRLFRSTGHRRRIVRLPETTRRQDVLARQWRAITWGECSCREPESAGPRLL